jgi:hypothetical protein
MSRSVTAGVAVLGENIARGPDEQRSVGMSPAARAAAASSIAPTQVAFVRFGHWLPRFTLVLASRQNEVAEGWLTL